MPDYIQLLETKLSPNQRQALNAMTDVARARGITLFLTGGAVRDIISGASVRDLDITVQANPLKFKKDLEKAGFSITGEHEASQTLYLRFGTQSRVEISAARTEKFPKPARPEYAPAGILDDLHRRDFTANAMALSLNEGSWGLLLDPLNGMADIASRQLRLVSNYGFLEDPIRMVRVIRLISRTGWEMDERTKARYENAKAEDVISSITAVQRGYELEEIAYEEEPLQSLKALEAEGWMQHLSPTWSSHSADAAGLERLHEKLVQLLMGGLHPDSSAAQFRLLTAKLSANHMSTLKKLFVRKDLIEHAEALDADAKSLMQQVTAKDAAKPSQLWKLLHGAKQEAVLWLFFTGKAANVQSKFESFFTKWPEARLKIPNAVLQDMRITPDVEGYAELLDKLTFAFMDGELPHEEAVRKFAEPYSPPAPPPPVIVRKTRSVKRVVEPKGSRGKGKKAGKKASTPETDELTLAAAEATGLPGNVAAAEMPVGAIEKSATPHKPDVESTVKGTAKNSAKTAAVVPPAAKTAAARPSAAKPAGVKSAVVKTAAKPKPSSPVPHGPGAQGKKPATKPDTSKASKSKTTSKPPTAAPAKKVVRAKPMQKSSAKAAVAPKSQKQAVGVPANKKAVKPAADKKPSAKPATSAAKTAVKKSASPSTGSTSKTTAKTTAKPAAKAAPKHAAKPAAKAAAKPAKAATKATPKPKPAAKKKSGK